MDNAVPPCFSRQKATLKACNGANRLILPCGSDKRLRDQSYTQSPCRLTATADSLKAESIVFLPFIVVNGNILLRNPAFVKGFLPFFFPIFKEMLAFP